jgi:NAD(P)-dependent dehydrogenase (short-subunit alcohol dehydrogenase family)
MLVEVDRKAHRRSGEAEKGVALVTGGRRGIGRAICVELAASGFDVAFVDLVDDRLAQETSGLIAAAGRRSLFVPFDIAGLDGHAALVDRVEAELGDLTCLVNNAGIQVSIRGDLLEVTRAEFDRLIDINLRATFFLTQEVARRMAGRPAGAANRSIVTVTSANAHLVSPEKTAYCVSKAGLSMAMQNFAVRLAEHGIGVHEIRPGLIETDMTADVLDRYTPSIKAGTICPLRRWGKPEEIAGAIALLASGAMPFSTGDIYNIGGGMQIPRL